MFLSIYTLIKKKFQIFENLQKDVVQTTRESQKLLDDFCLASRINVTLVENGFDENILCDKGNVSISLKEYAIRFDHIKEKIIKNFRAELTVKEKQLENLNKTIKRILNSYTYKTGRIIVSPFLFIKRLMGKK